MGRGGLTSPGIWEAAFNCSLGFEGKDWADRKLQAEKAHIPKVLGQAQSTAEHST